MENINLLLSSEDRNNKEIALLSLIGDQCSTEAISFFLDECLDVEFFSCKVVGSDFVIERNEYRSDNYYSYNMLIIIAISAITDEFLYICGNQDWWYTDKIPYYFKSKMKETKHGDDDWNEDEWDNRN